MRLYLYGNMTLTGTDELILLRDVMMLLSSSRDSGMKSTFYPSENSLGNCPERGGLGVSRQAMLSWLGYQTSLDHFGSLARYLSSF
jgi:hypothetical protein